MPDAPLTSEFYGARKGLVLSSGLLFGWEFLGISISSVSAGGQEVTVAYPEVMPYFLFATVAYFLFRVGVEWYQSPDEGRARSASRADFGVSLGIAAVAVLTFGVQQLSDIRVGEAVGGARPDALVSVLFGVMIALPVTLLVPTKMQSRRRESVGSGLVLLGISAAGLAYLWSSGHIDLSALLIGIVSGLFLSGLMLLLMWRREAAIAWSAFRDQFRRGY